MMAAHKKNSLYIRTFLHFRYEWTAFKNFILLFWALIRGNSFHKF